MKPTLQILSLAGLLPHLFSLAVAGDVPQLEIRRGGGSSVWLELTGVNGDEGWILQDSYDGVHWRDLREYPGSPVRDTLARRPVRLFRASMEPLDPPKEALNKARKNWKSLGLSAYQYVFSTSGEFGYVEQMAAVKDWEVFEQFTLQSPDFWDPGTPDTIEEVFEPYLIQAGFLQRTPQGRIATPKAMSHLGLTPEPGRQLAFAAE